jgi:hypothetical protein
VIVEGSVTALEPNTFLRFTVFDVRGEKPPVTGEDGTPTSLQNMPGRRRCGSYKAIFR